MAGFGVGSTHFTRHTAVRIDHVLAGPGWRVRRAWTGPFVGSAHRPVIAEVEPITATP
jgi:endonuclease/exonuclease/phosphatase (EEP) superfamily protein YafD